MRDNYKILIVGVGTIIAWMVALVIALAMGGCNKQLRMNYGAEVKMCYGMVIVTGKQIGRAHV